MLAADQLRRLPSPAFVNGFGARPRRIGRTDKFNAVTSARFADMVVDQLRRYDRENVQYVEFMVSFSCPNEREKICATICAAKR